MESRRTPTQRRERAQNPKAVRIAIIGAGAAGLSAAHYLKQKGYEHITVFDRRPRVGGKCHTRSFDGRRYELGALVVGNPYRRIRELIRTAGLDVATLSPIRIVDTRRPGDYMQGETFRSRASGLPILRLLAAYLAHRRRLSRPGYVRLEETSLAARSMAAWLERRRLSEVGAVLAPYYVGWGYGYLEQMSALYVFKLLDMYARVIANTRLISRSQPSMSFIPQGYQRLWEILSEPFELLLDVDIRAVRRKGRVTIEFDGTVRRFDSLILACPLDESLSFLDADPRERALFSKIRTIDFYSFTATVDGLPPHHLVFFGNHMTPSKSGHPVSWYRRWPDSNITVFYGIGTPDLSTDQLAANLEQDLAGLGARLRRVLHRDRWRYFPHVTASDLTGGFYRELESLQGSHRTWYAGELLSFPTVEHVAAYSHRLIADHF